jgi:hypothetical protein
MDMDMDMDMDTCVAPVQPVHFCVLVWCACVCMCVCMRACVCFCVTHCRAGWATRASRGSESPTQRRSGRSGARATKYADA